MARTIEKTLFKFDELTDRAKENARQWWRDLESRDFDSECVIDDAAECARIIGIEIDVERRPLMGGGTRGKPVIYWSGFCSQGDGACFEGAYSYVKGASKAIRAHAPQDRELHRIADALQAAQRRNFYGLEAGTTHSGRYQHSGSMRVDVSGRDYRDVSEDDAETIRDTLRHFADWIYGRLEAEYNYRMSDENVDESIRINEYEFDEAGDLA
jgi:hypothetical protein